MARFAAFCFGAGARAAGVRCGGVLAAQSRCVWRLDLQALNKHPELEMEGRWSRDRGASP